MYKKDLEVVAIATNYYFVAALYNKKDMEMLCLLKCMTENILRSIKNSKQTKEINNENTKKRNKRNAKHRRH